MRFRADALSDIIRPNDERALAGRPTRRERSGDGEHSGVMK